MRAGGLPEAAELGHLTDADLFLQPVNSSIGTQWVDRMARVIKAEDARRRPVLIVSTIFYALLTWMTARATSLEELRIVRVIGGLGMGAIMPNAMALVSEYSPQRSRYWRQASSQAFRSGFEQGYSQGYQQYGGYGNNGRNGRGSILGGILGRP